MRDGIFTKQSAKVKWEAYKSISQDEVQKWHFHPQLLSTIVLYNKSEQAAGRDEQVWLQEQHKPNQPWAAALLLSSHSVWAAHCVCSLVLQLKK